MNDEDVNKLRGVVKEEINTALEPIQKTLSEQTNKLDTLWEQVEKVTGELEEVKDKLDSHSSTLKRIEEKVDIGFDNTKKLDKRLTEVENKLGVVPPPELTAQ